MIEACKVANSYAKLYWAEVDDDGWSWLLTLGLKINTL